jgi:multidrug transporter EmrE-like cation transporter
MMLAAGVLNALAFVALTRALQLMPLVYVHALNATQATMAAVAGVLIFGEAQSSFLVSGLVLTIAGLLFMHGARTLPVE